MHSALVAAAGCRTAGSGGTNAGALTQPGTNGRATAAISDRSSRNETGRVGSRLYNLASIGTRGNATFVALERGGLRRRRVGDW